MPIETPIRRGHFRFHVRLLCALSLTVGVVGTYANILGAPFIYDDASAVRDNLTIRRLWPLSAPLSPPPSNNPMSGRPIANLSLAVNYAVGGLEPAGYHAMNIALHVACALLMFTLVRRTLERSVEPTTSVLIAFASVMLWAVHPLTSEPVDHISARTESLMAMFYLLTVYAAHRAWKSPRWIVVSVVACAVGMGSKESMVTAPLMVVLYDRAFQPDRPARSRRWFYAALAATWIVFLYVNWFAPRGHATALVADQGLMTPATPLTYALNQARLIPHYLRLALWPQGLVLDYGMVQPVNVGDVLGYAVLLLIAVAGLAWLWIVKPRIGFLGAWFAITLAPASSVVPVYTAVGAERRMYMPMMALTVAAVLAVDGLMRRSMAASRRRVVGAMATAVIVTILVIATIERNAEYASPLTMWTTGVERWPHGRARYNRAIALKAEGRRDEAMKELGAAAADYPEALSVLGVELIEQGKHDEGITALRSFIRQRPAHINVVGAHASIADALFARERYTEAISEYRAYLSMQPQAVKAWTNLGICLAATGNASEAVAAFRRAVALQPGIGDTHRNLANALLDAGSFPEAEREAREAVRLSPQDAVAREILSLALAKKR